MALGKLRRVQRGRRPVRRIKKRVFKRTNRRYIQRTAVQALETKKHQTKTDEQTVSTLSGYYFMDNQMALPQDDTYSGFDGHFVRGVGTKFNHLFFNSSSQTLLCRYVIIVNKQGSGNYDYSTGAGLFEDNNGNINYASATETQKMYSRINRDKYAVVCDKTFKLSPQGTDKNDSLIVKRWVNHKLQRYRFDGSSTFPTRNQVILLAWDCRADMDTTTGNSMEVSGIGTFYYKDI